MAKVKEWRKGKGAKNTKWGSVSNEQMARD